MTEREIVERLQECSLSISFNLLCPRLHHQFKLFQTKTRFQIPMQTKSFADLLFEKMTTEAVSLPKSIFIHARR